jgi:hypothetical protein
MKPRGGSVANLASLLAEAQVDGHPLVWSCIKQEEEHDHG